MVTNQFKYINVSVDELVKINEIKELKEKIDSLCCELVSDFYEKGLEVENVHDIMYGSGIVDIAGKFTVNKCIKEKYKNIITK